MSLVVSHWRSRPHTGSAFVTPSLYRFVRHPLYVGWVTAFRTTTPLFIPRLTPRAMARPAACVR
jgi:protein-S-isoprenylcysteine O-methyltransferase Ste14